MPFASEQGHGLKGLDLSHLVEEISRLALSNQRFGVSTQTIELSKHRKGSGPGGGSGKAMDHGELSLRLALSGCRRRSLAPRLSQEGLATTLRSEYLDSRCVWNHLQHYDHHQQILEIQKRLQSKGIATAATNRKALQSAYAMLHLVRLHSSNYLLIS